MVAVLGAGESGLGAAVLAKQKGLEVFVSDAGRILSANKAELTQYFVDFEEGGHRHVFEINPQLVVKSPGIPEQSEVVKHFKHRKIEVISELEFAFRFTSKPILAITGSNGKTTTTRLCSHILRSAGLRICEAGNIGLSFARAVAAENCDWYVLEVSSFQLDGVKFFSPQISVLLNITEDHLDRYNNCFDDYVAAKCRIFENQTPTQHFIYNAADRAIETALAKRVVWPKTYPIYSTVDENGRLYNGGTLVADLSPTVLRGQHNALNCNCAIQACLLAGAPYEAIVSALPTFVNDPHRLECCSHWNGVEWINDSKATNVASVWHAIEGMRKPVVWIAGGIDKGNDYAPLEALVRKKVKALIGLGADNSKLINFFKGKIEHIVDTHSMEEALQEAKKLAVPGDVVLLSPACASFDLFKNYEDRGNQFKSVIQGWESHLETIKSV